MRLWIIMELWFIVALLSLIAFVFGLLSSIKANRYLLSHGMLEGKPSTIRKKATVRMIVAYLMLFTAFIIYYFQLLP